MGHLLKVALAANLFEWYEFIVYAYLSDVIGQLFFPPTDAIGGLMKAFSIFAIGYLARPLGSLFFSRMGDRVGRGRPLKITLLLAAIPTVLIGLLPTYQEIGLFAPALLLLLRLAQGFAMGWEVPGNACYIFETAPAHRRSVLCSLGVVSLNIGNLLAALITFLLFSSFDSETIRAWAWRIPFLFSLPLAIGIATIRRTIQDVPASQQTSLDFNVLKSILFRTLPIASFSLVFFYALMIWLPSYLTHFLNYPPHLVQLGNSLSLVALIVSQLTAGYCAQRMGYQRVIRWGILTTIILICPLWLGFQQNAFSIVLAAQLLLALLQGSINGVIMEALLTQFPPWLRCRGITFAYTFPAVFVGGATPLILTWMTDQTGLMIVPAFYILFFGLLALPAALQLKN